MESQSKFLKNDKFSYNDKTALKQELLEFYKTSFFIAQDGLLVKNGLTYFGRALQVIEIKTLKTFK